MPGTLSWEELKSLPYKKWYQFGWRSISVLIKRTKSKHRWARPIFRLHMMWQRANHGFSVEDCWSLDRHLAHVTIGGIKNLRKWSHGYPSELGSMEAWDTILARIQEGFEAWLDQDGWFHQDPGAEAKFNEGMALYAKWFGGLWD